jgi:predicted MPP superfamily phosphohydrolase
VIHFIQPYVKGLYRVGEMWLYINRGTGHWGPPVRLGTAPEITFIRITRT